MIKTNQIRTVDKLESLMEITPCALGTGLPYSGFPKGRSPLAARRVNALRCGIPLRVSLSQEIEGIKQSGTTPEDKNRIAMLRNELQSVLDELAIARNIEKSRAKEALITEIRSTEAKTKEQYERMLSLAEQILPRLKEIEPMLNALSEANLKRVQFNTQLDGCLERYRSTYEEILEVKKPMVAVAQMVDEANLRDCIIRLVRQWDSHTSPTTAPVVENKAPQSSSEG